MQIDLIQLTIDIVAISQKASELAVLVRGSEVFGSSTEEKAHPRVQDFKTVSDVIIQEMLRYDVSTKYGSEFSQRVYGEEDPHFLNPNGQNIDLTITNDKASMKKNICLALDCREDFAEQLVKVIYQPFDIISQKDPVKTVIACLKENIRESLLYKNEDVGIWIDPIDGTNEYVKGRDPTESQEKFLKIKSTDSLLLDGSLTTTEVLIGAFDINTKEPIIGIINSPFHNINGTNVIIAGLNVGKSKWTYLPSTQEECKIPFGMKKMLSARMGNSKYSIMCGSQDFEALQLRSKGNHVIVNTPGAGFKILSVILGEMDVFYKTDNLIYLYDVCGPMAILQSLGGGMASAKDTIEAAKKIIAGNPDDLERQLKELLLSRQIKFIKREAKDTNISLKDGLIAYLNIDRAIDFIKDFFKSDDQAPSIID